MKRLTGEGRERFVSLLLLWLEVESLLLLLLGGVKTGER